MFITKVFTFLEVIRDYENLLVEVSWYGNNGGNICTYTYKHPQLQNRCTISLMTMSNKKWAATLKGNLSLDSISFILGSNYNYSDEGFNSRESLPEAVAVFSEEDLLPLMNRFTQNVTQ